MAYDISKIATLGQLKLLAERTKGELDLTIRTILVAGNTVNFYTEKNATAANTPAFTFDFPSEIFLDQATTDLIQSFAWSSALYPNSTNPNLDGKQVLVLGVKTVAADGTSTIAYSFVDLTGLIEIVDIASGDSSKILSIAENGKTRTISVHISAQAGNALSVKADGLYATANVSGAVQGNVASFGANGAIADSGTATADLLTKVANATADHIVTLNADGTIKDSGKAFATDTETAEMITEVFGASA